MKTNECIKALHIEKEGNWDLAHRIVQGMNSSEAAWVHAYLHRVEGDLGNAAYWYRNANRPVCTTSLEEEWNDIYDELN